MSYHLTCECGRKLVTSVIEGECPNCRRLYVIKWQFDYERPNFLCSNCGGNVIVDGRCSSCGREAKILAKEK